MNLSPEDIDRLFKEEAERLADVPPRTSFSHDHFWGQLQTRIVAPRVSRRQLVLRVAAGILLLLLGWMAGWQWHFQQQQFYIHKAKPAVLKMASATQGLVTDTAQTTPAPARRTLLEAAPKAVRQRRTMAKRSLLISAVTIEQYPPKAESAGHQPLPDTLPPGLIRPVTNQPQPMPKVRKPLRMVHANVLHQENSCTYTDHPPVFVRTGEAQHPTPKLTISFPSKHNQ